MKSFVAILALPALFVSTLAAPSASNGISFEKRQASGAFGLVSSLFTEVQKGTGSINSTVAGLNCESTLVENATATLSIITEIDSITTAINSAANQTALIGSGLGSPLLIRQATTGNVTAAALAGLTEEVLLDLNGALSGVLSALGLSPLLGSLSPLLKSLSTLLLNLEPVVDNLLEVVRELVDGLLTGLAIGLGGLTL